MSERVYIPVANVFEKEDAFLLVLDMPGTAKEDIDIEVNGDNLIITSKTKNISEEWTPLSKEFKFGSYRRSFSLGNQIDRDKIDAVYENGILKIFLSKSEASKPKKIDVKIAS